MDTDEPYFTHPDEMRGASSRKQNTLMHQQLKTFTSTLQLITDEHDTSAVYHMLNRVVPYNHVVSSVLELNKRIDRWYRDHKWSRDTDITATISDDFTAFQQNIQLLKQLKVNFDDRIYSVLFEFYYEMVMEEIPEAIRLLQKNHKIGGEVRGSNLLVMSNIDDYAALRKSMPTQMLIDISAECDSLFAIIYQLQNVNIQWGMLLKGDESINVDLFSPESIQDVKPYPNYRRFEAVLRLIPDLLRKARTASDLANKWWYRAEMIRRRLRGQKTRANSKSKIPVRRKQSEQTIPRHEDPVQSMEEYNSRWTPEQPNYDHAHEETSVHSPIHGEDAIEDDKVLQRPAQRIPHRELLYRSLSEHDFPLVRETIERHLKELSTSIALYQMDLAAENSEMNFIQRRRERARKLKANLQRAAVAMETLHKQLVKYRRAKEHLVRQIETSDYHGERQRLEEKLNLLEEKVQDVQELARGIEYRYKLTASDLKLELDMKESLDSYYEEVQRRAEKLQSEIEEEETERDRLMNELALLGLQVAAEVDKTEQNGMRRDKMLPDLEKRKAGRDKLPTDGNPTDMSRFDEHTLPLRKQNRRDMRASPQDFVENMTRTTPRDNHQRHAVPAKLETFRSDAFPRLGERTISRPNSSDTWSHRSYRIKEPRDFDDRNHQLEDKSFKDNQRRRVPLGRNLPPLNDSDEALSNKGIYDLQHRRSLEDHLSEVGDLSPYPLPEDDYLTSSKRGKEPRGRYRNKSHHRYDDDISGVHNQNTSKSLSKGLSPRDEDHGVIESPHGDDEEFLRGTRFTDSPSNISHSQNARGQGKRFQEDNRGKKQTRKERSTRHWEQDNHEEKDKTLDDEEFFRAAKLEDFSQDNRRMPTNRREAHFPRDNREKHQPLDDTDMGGFSPGNRHQQVQRQDARFTMDSLNNGQPYGERVQPHRGNGRLYHQGGQPQALKQVKNGAPPTFIYADEDSTRSRSPETRSLQQHPKMYDPKREKLKGMKFKNPGNVASVSGPMKTHRPNNLLPSRIPIKSK